PPVIRASGGRCDFSPPAFCVAEACMGATGGRPLPMPSAALKASDAPVSVDAERVREIVRVRVASAGRGIARPDLVSELAGIVSHRLSAGQWRALLDTAVDALVADGSLVRRSDRLEVSETGIARAAQFLAVKGALPSQWSELRDVRLIAKALGLQRE